MRHGTSNRRSRGRNNNRGKGGNNRAQVFDSNGPEVRIRGTAHQICEKYAALAKDAKSSGDHVLAESYLQHAEHYQRMITTWDEQQAAKAPSVDKTEDKSTDKSISVEKTQEQNDDLALPSSILGGEVKTASEGVLEDA